MLRLGDGDCYIRRGLTRERAVLMCGFVGWERFFLIFSDEIFADNIFLLTFAPAMMI